MNTKKVIVFGGAGFLGSHVADHLLEKGFDVTIFDRKESPYLQSGHKMVVGNLLDMHAVEEAVSDARYVYNFSGDACLDDCASNPTTAIENNIMGHSLLLEACRRQGVERIFYASTVYVYSKQGSFYKITKQTCEQITEEYFKAFGLDYTILRYGSLYGPRAQKWNGVQKYLMQAIQENKIDYPGTGSERREYIHVVDAAKLSVQVIESEYRNKIVTLTGNDALSSRDLMQMIKEMLDHKIEINFTDEKMFHHYQMTPYSFTPSIGMKLSPNPYVDMGEGLLRQMESIYHAEQKQV